MILVTFDFILYTYLSKLYYFPNYIFSPLLISVSTTEFGLIERHQIELSYSITSFS